MSRNKNIKADRESKELSVNLEWMLCPESLSKAWFFIDYGPNVDLFCDKDNVKVYNTYNNIINQYIITFPFLQTSAIDLSINFPVLKLSL